MAAVPRPRSLLRCLCALSLIPVTGAVDDAAGRPPVTGRLSMRVSPGKGAVMGAKIRSLLIVLPLILAPAAARAGAPEGDSAYQRGDYATAMAEWQSVAGSGDPTASYGIGQIYRLGKGVPYRDFEK